MVPVMYVLSGTFEEPPQRTHFWNNMKLERETVDRLERSSMVFYRKDDIASKRFFSFIPLFHMPIFGGWKRYVVIRPAKIKGVWHVGWIAEDVCGISRIPLYGSVRLLLGDKPVSFFGVNEKTGEQILLRKIGFGVIGERDEYSSLPLL